MNIQITGASIKQNGNQFQVIYKDKIVFEHKSPEVCMVTALSKSNLDSLLYSSSNS